MNQPTEGAAQPDGAPPELTKLYDAAFTVAWNAFSRCWPYETNKTLRDALHAAVRAAVDFQVRPPEPGATAAEPDADKRIMTAHLDAWQAARGGARVAFNSAFTEAVNAAYRAGGPLRAMREIADPSDLRSL